MARIVAGENITITLVDDDLTVAATGGAGAVESVNTQTGAVVLDADDLDDTSTTHKFTTAANLTKLAGIEAGADVTDAANVAAAGAVMTTATDASGYGFVLDEDAMTSNSATKLPTQQSVKAYVDAAVTAGGGYTDEQVRDVIGTALVAGSNVTITVDDASDTITIASAASGGGSSLTPPLVADFAWVNQGSATAASGSGGLWLGGANASGDNIHALVKSAPATPYAVTVKITVLCDQNANAGIGWRDSASGKLAVLRARTISSGAGMRSSTFSAPTSFNTDYSTANMTLQMLPSWWRIADDGANRICSISLDGEHWLTLHSVGRTDYLTADQVMLYIDPASSGPGGTAIYVEHWAVS